MKKILLLTIFSLSFCGTAYVGYSTSAEWKFPTLNDDFDKTDILIGYNHPFWSNDTGMSLSIGLNYSISPLVQKEIFGSYDIETYQLYIQWLYSFSENFSTWISCGHVNGDDDNYWSDYFTNYTQMPINSDFNGGISYGLGLHYTLSDNWGVGLGLSTSIIEIEYGDGGNSTLKDDWDIDKSTIFISYTF